MRDCSVCVHICYVRACMLFDCARDYVSCIRRLLLHGSLLVKFHYFRPSSVSNDFLLVTPRTVVKLSDDFNGADLRNVCTEAGMFAIRADRDFVIEEDFMKAVRKAS